jgi:hypothetical protein
MLLVVTGGVAREFERTTVWTCVVMAVVVVDTY